MAVLASDIMDGAAIILNDSAKSLYSYATQLPYLKKANQELEQELIIIGAPVQRTKSATISVLANAKTLTLPSDFLIPLTLKERNSGSSDPWTDMVEKAFLPDNAIPDNLLRVWQFANNNINFVGSIINRDVLLNYDRMLAVINSQNSAEDFYLSSVYLSARTAELCARYIGMNKTMADQIRDDDVAAARDNLMRVFVLQSQGTSTRRPKFSTTRRNFR
jgi:hypothetical protein